MCVEPQWIPTRHKEDISGTWAACRKCWQCTKDRVNDYVGRCIAEQQIAPVVLAATLTYSGDAPNTVTLQYKDFQDFMKRLRKRYPETRYIVAGEYGSANGRAHWHVILFFHGDAPRIVEHSEVRQPWDIVLPRFDDDPDARIQWAPWSNHSNNGFAYVQSPDYGGFHYALKYALKDEADQLSQGKFAMSKKPPLGDAYFRRLALDHVEQGLVPRSLRYAFSHVKDKLGRVRQYTMQGKTADNFWRTFCDAWAEKYGEPPAYGVYEALDLWRDANIELDDDELQARDERNAAAVEERRPQRVWVEPDPEDGTRWAAVHCGELILLEFVQSEYANPPRDFVRVFDYETGEQTWHGDQETAATWLQDVEFLSLVNVDGFGNPA